MAGELFLESHTAAAARDVLDCYGDSLGLPDDHDQLLVACDAGVDQVPLQ